MSDDPTGLIPSAIAGLRADVQAEVAGLWADMEAVMAGPRVEMTGLRADMEAGAAKLRTNMQAEAAGSRAEFTAMRTNLLSPSERALNEVSALRDDRTVVTARPDRMDATVHGCVMEVRAPHRQISRIAGRVTELAQR